MGNEILTNLYSLFLFFGIPLRMPKKIEEEKDSQQHHRARRPGVPAKAQRKSHQKTDYPQKK
jgi:hypothetical protein